MKKFRNFGIAMVALALVATLTGCKFSLNDEQLKIYDGFIDNVYNRSKLGTVSSTEIDVMLKTANLACHQKDFKIVDMNEGKAIESGTERVKIEARFQPRKLK